MTLLSDKKVDCWIANLKHTNLLTDSVKLLLFNAAKNLCFFQAEGKTKIFIMINLTLFRTCLQ